MWLWNYTPEIWDKMGVFYRPANIFNSKSYICLQVNDHNKSRKEDIKKDLTHVYCDAWVRDDILYTST